MAVHSLREKKWRDSLPLKTPHKQSAQHSFVNWCTMRSWFQYGGETEDKSVNNDKRLRKKPNEHTKAVIATRLAHKLLMSKREEKNKQEHIKAVKATRLAHKLLMSKREQEQKPTSNTNPSTHNYVHPAKLTFKPLHNKRTMCRQNSGNQVAGTMHGTLW